MSNYARSLTWYERPLGSPPAFLPEQRETYDNGVRKITFRDPDGNQIGSEERLWRPSRPSRRMLSTRLA